MAEITLVAETERASGSRPSRRLRAAGRIPAVVYGHGMEPVSISVDKRDLRAALGTEAGARALLQLRVGKERHLAMARHLQRHPVRHSVIHVDFQIVRRDEVITAEVPVVLVGDAVAVQRGDGMVDQEIQALPIKAKPADLPPHLEVDISELEIGAAIRVGEVVLPEGVVTDVDPESVVVVAHPPRVIELPEVAVEEAEGGPAEGTGAPASDREDAGEGGTAGTAGGDS